MFFFRAPSLARLGIWPQEFLVIYGMLSRGRKKNKEEKHDVSTFGTQTGRLAHVDLCAYEC